MAELVAAGVLAYFLIKRHESAHEQIAPDIAVDHSGKAATQIAQSVARTGAPRIPGDTSRYQSMARQMTAANFPHGISRFKKWDWVEEKGEHVPRYTVNLHDLDPALDSKLPYFYDSQNHHNYGILSYETGHGGGLPSTNMTYLPNGEIVPFPRVRVTAGSKAYYPNDAIL